MPLTQVPTGMMAPTGVTAGSYTLSNITVDASGRVTAASNGSVNTLTSGTVQNTTSGTSIDFTGIPSWVKRITVMLNGVSTTGTSNLQIQLGNGSIVTTGYISNSWTANTVNNSTTTAFFITASNGATAAYYGNAIFCLQTGNTWVESHAIGGAGSNNCIGGGTVSLSSALDRLRLTTQGGIDTFDAGSVNILYE